MRGGLVGLALCAIAFAQPENRRGRHRPVLVKLRRERLVVRNGRVEIAIGLLLKQPLLQQRGQFVGLRGRHQPRQQ